MPFRTPSDWFVLLMFLTITALFISRVATVDKRANRNLAAGVSVSGK